jgi:RNA polymerase sigma factor (sigma-70 family)
MRDGEMVAAIVSGDPAALAATYDHYAPALYGYCRSLLSDPAEAADAVQDTFVVAVAKLSGLRDPSRLRPWLYAVARNECHRRLHGPHSAAPFDDDATGISARTADFGAALEQAEMRELVWSALAGLEPGDQEVIELTLRHEFYGADLADALGVPRNQAQALASRAQNRFEAALGALMMSRSGQESCPELAEILGGWDGELNNSVRRQVRRHLGSCPMCEEQRRRQVNPTALLGMLPPAVLPAGLRYQVLGLTSDEASDAVAYCTEAARRAEPFNRAGFPAPLDPLAAARGPASFMPAAGVLVAVFAVFGGGAMLAANTLHHSAPPVSSAVAPAPSATAAPPATPSPSSTGSAHSGQKPGNTTPVGPLQPGGTQGYLPGNGTSAATQPAKSGGHSATSSPTKTKHSTPPTTPVSTPPTTPVSTPPTTPVSTPPTTPVTTPPASGTSGDSGTLSGLLGGVIGLLHVV